MSESLEANYARGGFGQHLAPGRAPALLLIDFVEAYLAPASPLYAGAEPVRAAAGRLLEAARAAAMPIVHTNLDYQPGGRNGGILYRKLPVLKCFDRGLHPEWAAFTRGLEPAAGETVVSKQYASAFFGTTLASTFTSLGIDTVILAGLSTSGCVRASAVDCCRHGFIPLVVREAVGDRAREPHEANLFDLQAKYAEVVSLDDAAARAVGIAGSATLVSGLAVLGLKFFRRFGLIIYFAYGRFIFTLVFVVTIVGIVFGARYWRCYDPFRWNIVHKISRM